MAAPSPRRTAADPRGLRLFTRLARIAASTADLGGPVHADLHRDLRALEQEAGRELPRPAVALALADEVLAALAGVLSAPALELLGDARDDVRHPHTHPDLHVVDDVSEAG